MPSIQVDGQRSALSIVEASSRLSSCSPNILLVQTKCPSDAGGSGLHDSATPSENERTRHGGRSHDRPATDPASTKSLSLIDAAKRRAYQAVNTERVTLLAVGEYINKEGSPALSGAMASSSSWRGHCATVSGLRGSRAPTCFACASSSRAYCHHEKSRHWCDIVVVSHHLIILGRANRRGTTVLHASRDCRAVDEAGLYPAVSRPRVSACGGQAASSIDGATKRNIRGRWSCSRMSLALEFLELPDEHTEADLHRGLLRNLGRFITRAGS